MIGARNSGKTSFINFLRTSLALPPQKNRSLVPDETYDARAIPLSVGFPNFSSQYLETEIGNERIGLTLWDSQGLERNVVDLQLREISSFVESKFEDTFAEENKVARSPGFRDTHIHCTFLILDPTRLDANIASSKKAEAISGAKANGNSFAKHRSTDSFGGLDENLDLQTLRALKGKTTVVPIIAKADAITSVHMIYLKRAVWESIKRAKLDDYETIGLGDNAEESASDDGEIQRLERPDIEGRKLSDTSHLDSPSDSDSSLSGQDYRLTGPLQYPAIRHSRTPSSPVPVPIKSVSSKDIPYLPLSVISPDLYEPDIAGRKFPWGFADPFNPDHCDFSRLKEMIFSEWRGELREASRELWYEAWRTSRLNRRSARGEPRSPARGAQMGYAR